MLRRIAEQHVGKRSLAGQTVADAWYRQKRTQLRCTSECAGAPQCVLTATTVRSASLLGVKGARSHEARSHTGTRSQGHTGTRSQGRTGTSLVLAARAEACGQGPKHGGRNSSKAVKMQASDHLSGAGPLYHLPPFKRKR